MKKYIDAETFIAHCCDSCVKSGVCCCPTNDSCDYIEDLQAFLSDAPVADVAEVVRCKDCRYFDVTQTYLCDMHHRAANEDDYCSYGIRKMDSEKELGE